MGEMTSNCRIEVMDEAIAERLQQMSPEECVALVGDANETARILVAAGTRHLHPEWSEEQIRADVARRMSGDTA